jgi:hypothetical protein
MCARKHQGGKQLNWPGYFGLQTNHPRRWSLVVPDHFAGWGLFREGVKYNLKKPSGVIMSTAVKLAETLIDQPRRYANVAHRSVPKQIEYWSQIGRIAEENPENYLTPN